MYVCLRMRACTWEAEASKSLLSLRQTVLHRDLVPGQSVLESETPPQK